MSLLIQNKRLLVQKKKKRSIATLIDCLQFLDLHGFQGDTNISSWMNFRVKWLKMYVKKVLTRRQGVKNCLPKDGSMMAGNLLIVQSDNEKHVKLLLNPALNLRTTRKTQCKLTTQNLKDFGHNVLGWPMYHAINSVAFDLWSALVTFDWQFRLYEETEIFPVHCLGKLHVQRVQSVAIGACSTQYPTAVS